MHHSQAGLHHRRIRCKNAEQLCSKRHDQGTEKQSTARRHRQTDLRSLFDTVILSSTEILADKRRHCDAVCAIHHPEHAVDLSKGRPRRHRIHTKRI